MKEKIKEYWWIIIIALFIGGAFYWFQWRPIQIRKEQASIGQQKQEELKMQLLEEQINSLQQETAQKQQEAQQQALKEQQTQEFQIWVNSCIVKAQNERDKRERLIDNAWLMCGELGLSSEQCEKYKDYSTVEGYYKGWEANCKRGISNNF